MRLKNITDKKLLTNIEKHMLEEEDIKDFKTLLELKEYLKKLSSDRNKIKTLILKLLKSKNIITNRKIKEEIKKKGYKINKLCLLFLIDDCVEKIYYDFVLDLVKKFGYEKITKKHIKLYCKSHSLNYDKYYIKRAIDKIF